MPQVAFNGQQYAVADGESVLDCLLRHGQAVPYSCKTGLCQSCLVQAVDCTAPAKASQGLKATLQASGHALACQWMPDGDVNVQLPGGAVSTTAAQITQLQLLNEVVMKLLVKPAARDASIECRPGQYMNLINPAGVIRSYSVANDYQRDGVLEFHIANTAQGLFTKWLFNEARVGDGVELRGPAGTCFYLPSTDQNEPLLLSALGTGLAPLYGILQDALTNGHRGPITLIHGSGKPELLYYQDELQALTQQYPNFSYHGIVLDNPRGISTCTQGDAEQETLARLDPSRLGDTRVYLCGNPGFVQRLRKQSFLKGVRSANIFCDAFVERAVPSPA
jgi:CDP-4-dehydro-6-deoxyglucose reductase